MEKLLSERDMVFMDCIRLSEFSWIARDESGLLNLHICDDREGIELIEDYLFDDEIIDDLNMIRFWAPKNSGGSICIDCELFKFITFDHPLSGEELKKMYYDQKYYIPKKMSCSGIFDIL